ncbi:hypothetical protein AAF712_011263 [Marasmius tenuissimus]|uniref:Uncharacterized protein n=1 Tax=Marasmius tenuissimus TaxID=585030 RepID=A0ABR2ZNC2_9AGAR
MLSSPGMEEHVRTEGPSGDRHAAGTQVVHRKRGPKKNRKKTKKRGPDKKAMEDGWIWQPKVLFTRIDLSSQKQLAYDKECNHVQSFHAWTERDCWQECVKKLEANFRNCIRHFTKMKTVWDMAGSSADSPGHQAYAQRQASMFKRLQTDAETLLAQLGIELELPLGEILADCVAQDRCQTLAEDEATIKKLLEEAEAERDCLREALGPDGDESETVDKERQTDIDDEESEMDNGNTSDNEGETPSDTSGHGHGQVREVEVRVEVGAVVEQIREAGEDEAQHAVEVEVTGQAE